MTPPYFYTELLLENGIANHKTLFVEELHKSYDNGIKMKDTFIRVSGWLIMMPLIIGGTRL